jgi:hypothetical protein
VILARLYNRAMQARRLAALALLSAGTLAYEFCLTRLLAIQQFHHFGFLVIGLAIMGLAAGGVVLSLLPTRPSLALQSSAFGASVVAAYLALNLLPFDSYSIAWDRRQAAILLVYFLASAAPLFLSGWATAGALSQAGEAAFLPYAASLLGGAWGLLGAMAIAVRGVPAIAALSAACGLAAAALDLRPWPARALAGAFALVTLVLGARAPEWLAVRVSPYKPLVSALLAGGARHLAASESLSSRLDVVESPSLHAFPGLSLQYSGPLPQQTSLYLDADGPYPVTHVRADSAVAVGIARSFPSALAYSLRPEARTLVLQSGGGLEVLTALALGSDSVVAPQPEPLTREYLGGDDYLWRDPRVQSLPVSDRVALQAGGTYDIVDFALSDAYRPVTSGAFALGENYLLTVPAIQAAFGALESDGILVLTRWLTTPPAESTRAWATAIAGLRAEGMLQPEAHLAVYRGLRTSTLLASRRPWTDVELAGIRRFLNDEGWDAIYLPGLHTDETNRTYVVPSNPYPDLFAQLLADPQAAYAASEFAIRPATDDRPYFFHFFRWRQTPETLASLGQTWQPYGGSGYFVLLGLLGLSLLLSIPMFVIPGWKYRRRMPAGRVRTSPAHFALLGGAFIFVEIGLLQQLTLLVDRPALSFALVVGVLLAASGLGSLASPRVSRSSALLVAATAAAVLAGGALPVIHSALGLPLSGRIVLAAALVAVPGVAMGVPFPGALRELEREARGSIAWAWAINGSASGIGGVLAALVSLDWGIRATLLLGALMYLGAWATTRLPASSRQLPA